MARTRIESPTIAILESHCINSAHGFAEATHRLLISLYETHTDLVHPLSAPRILFLRPTWDFQGTGRDAELYWENLLKVTICELSLVFPDVRVLIPSYYQMLDRIEKRCGATERYTLQRVVTALNYYYKNLILS